jgi:hypothetical protein
MSADNASGLPQELWDEIISYLDGEIWEENLAEWEQPRILWQWESRMDPNLLACSLVCRAWRSSALAYLFKRFLFVEEAVRPSRRLKKGIMTLRRQPSLAKYVREVNLVGAGVSPTPRKYPTSNFRYYCFQFIALASRGGLDSLTITSTVLDASIDNHAFYGHSGKWIPAALNFDFLHNKLNPLRRHVPSAFREALQSIKHLALYYVTFSAFEDIDHLLHAIPHLESLEFAAINWKGLPPTLSSLPRHDLQLKSLSLLSPLISSLKDSASVLAILPPLATQLHKLSLDMRSGEGHKFLKLLEYAGPGLIDLEIKGSGARMSGMPYSEKRRT